MTKLVTEYFQGHASHFSLKAEAVRAEYVLNWGGFVNHSFTVSDGLISYHLKLTSEPDSLRRWECFHTLLEERYHAPQMIAWVQLPVTEYEGLLFHHIVGHYADFRKSPDLLRAVIAMVGRLHADRELAEQLESLEGEQSYLDSFVGTYIERLDGDLGIIASNLPSFVTPGTLRWMERETRMLERLARSSPAFSRKADAPIHGDLYENNILVTAEKSWFLLDWDDLTLGDPALDYAILLWGLLYGEEGLFGRDFSVPATDPDFSQRMELYLRAQLLNQVIDALADYVECAIAPEQQGLVQAHKRQEHLEALSRYRGMYS